MAKKKDEAEESGLPVGLTEEEFFDIPANELTKKNARIFVTIKKEIGGISESGEPILYHEDKLIEAGKPQYWKSILRDKKTGEPMKKQELHSYKLTENGETKQYLFKK